MNWIAHAKSVFNYPKPKNFTNFQHCNECFEYNLILQSLDVDSIKAKHLTNEADSPLPFMTIEGLLYFMPAFVRLVLETINRPKGTFLDCFISILIRDGEDNNLVSICNYAQKRFITEFLEFLMEEFPQEFISPLYPAFNILRCYEIWYVPK